MHEQGSQEEGYGDIVMPTPEFVAEADWILGEIFYRMTDADLQIAKHAIYQVMDEPSPMAMAATGTPPDSKLLGMYEYEPVHRVTIFQKPLEWLAEKRGSIYAVVRDTLDHEIYQHALGWDHVKETAEMGLLPALAVPCG